MIRTESQSLFRPVSVHGLAAAVLIVSLVSTAQADLVVLGAAADNTLIEDFEGDVSSGGSTGMFAGRNNQSSNSRRRGVILFDIAGIIPAGSTINTVTLQLSQSSANTAATTVSLHRVLAAWGEGTATTTGGQGAPAGIGDATWVYSSYNTVAWVTPGGDFAPAASSQTVIAGTGDYQWPSTTSLLADVQSFLDNPAINFGWLLLGEESASQTVKRFSTREEPDEALRPQLIVDYTPVPEPGTAALLLAGVWFAVSRRRKP